MNRKRLIASGVIVVMIYSSLTGCAALNIPKQVVGLAWNIAKGAWNLLQKLPKPPPGVF